MVLMATTVVFPAMSIVPEYTFPNAPMNEEILCRVQMLCMVPLITITYVVPKSNGIRNITLSKTLASVYGQTTEVYN